MLVSGHIGKDGAPTPLLGTPTLEHCVADSGLWWCWAQHSWDIADSFHYHLCHADAAHAFVPVDGGLGIFSAAQAPRYYIFSLVTAQRC